MDDYGNLEYNPVEQEAIAGLFRAPSHPGVELQKKKKNTFFYIF